VEVLDGEFDIYYQRAGNNIANAYRFEESRNFIHYLYGRLNPGGHFVTDDHALNFDPEIGIDDLGPEFPIQLDEIVIPGIEEIEEAIVTAAIPGIVVPESSLKKAGELRKNTRNRYGWAVRIRQKPVSFSDEAKKGAERKSPTSDGQNTDQSPADRILAALPKNVAIYYRGVDDDDRHALNELVRVFRAIGIEIDGWVNLAASTSEGTNADVFEAHRVIGGERVAVKIDPAWRMNEEKLAERDENYSEVLHEVLANLRDNNSLDCFEGGGFGVKVFKTGEVEIDAYGAEKKVFYQVQEYLEGERVWDFVISHEDNTELREIILTGVIDFLSYLRGLYERNVVYYDFEGNSNIYVQNIGYQEYRLRAIDPDGLLYVEDIDRFYEGEEVSLLTGSIQQLGEELYWLDKALRFANQTVLGMQKVAKDFRKKYSERQITKDEALEELRGLEVFFSGKLADNNTERRSPSADVSSEFTVHSSQITESKEQGTEGEYQASNLKPLTVHRTPIFSRESPSGETSESKLVATPHEYGKEQLKIRRETAQYIEPDTKVRLLVELDRRMVPDFEDDESIQSFYENILQSMKTDMRRNLERFVGSGDAVEFVPCYSRGETKQNVENAVSENYTERTVVLSLSGSDTFIDSDGGLTRRTEELGIPHIAMNLPNEGSGIVAVDFAQLAHIGLLVQELKEEISKQKEGRGDPDEIFDDLVTALLDSIKSIQPHKIFDETKFKSALQKSNSRALFDASIVIQLMPIEKIDMESPQEWYDAKRALQQAA
ncbi:MAG: hypothetical protein ABIJ27_06735, partial [Candidatus Omnitrophota bacterium]